jgi:DNA repair protein RadA/Sms
MQRSCKEWNTIAEEIIQKQEKTAWKSESAATSKAPKPLRIKQKSIHAQRNPHGYN